uniref:TFIIS N-terminal domain-containing protein n=1 Tax=Alexandrium monilatum TaxID=311494 RepID=A0A7S4SHA8_9DINO
MAGSEDDGDVPVIEEVEPPRCGEASAERAEGADGAAGDGPDEELRKIEREKEGMSVTERLERSFLYKVEGNDLFKSGDVFRAADCYYRAVVYARDLMQNPQYYPKLGHTEAQRETARGLVESSFGNLALVQSKHALGLPEGPERERVLREGARSAGEALRINAANAKALYRRGLCRARLARAAAARSLAGGDGAELREARALCAEAREDLVSAARADEGAAGRDARAELRAVQDLAKSLRREELLRDKRGFSFQGSLGALQPEEEDLLGDGSVRRRQVLCAGDGARWFNEDWLLPTSRQRCVVHTRCHLLGGGGDAEPKTLAFTLGDSDMHEGIQVAVRALSKGGRSRFAIAERRLTSSTPLARRLSQVPTGESEWEVELLRFSVYEDRGGDGRELLKVFSEGYGRFPEELSECHLHWKVTGPDDSALYSSRCTVSVGGAGGIEQREDPDRAPFVYVLGETTWPPVATLCRALRQGGRAELRLKRAPALPDPDPGAPADAVGARLGAALGKGRAAAGGGGGLEDCAVLVELERVLPPAAGPAGDDWGGVAALVQERFRAEQLLERSEDAAALRRLRRACGWAQEALAGASGEASATAAEHAAMRATLAWALARRAAPILDLGTVSSDCVKAAEADLAEAEAHCAWLEEHHPGLAAVRLVRAKLLVARDDDFEGAHAELSEAQRLAPEDGRVQQELRAVRAALRSQREARGRERAAALREGLAAARAGGPGGAAAPGARELLAELAALELSWEAVTETRVGAEVRRLREASSDPEARRLCADILGRWVDQSREQRPLWES